RPTRSARAGRGGTQACVPSAIRRRTRRRRGLLRAARRLCASRRCLGHPSPAPSCVDLAEFGTRKSTGTPHLRRRQLLQGGEEEFVHARAQVGEGRGVGVAGGAEDSVEGIGGGGRSDGKA